MRKTFIAIPGLFVALTLSSCGRTERAAETGQPNADMQAQQQEREQYIAQMEQRISGLEQKLAEMRDRPAATGVRPERMEELQEDIKELRQEVADLRTAGAENWWPMTQRSLERSKAEVESEIEEQTTGATGATGTRARTEEPGAAEQRQPQAEQASGQDVSAQRQQFITRMENDLKQLEQQLDKVGQSRARRTDEVEDVREELAELKREISNLQDMDEQNWWESTRNRLDRSADRLEQSIQGMTEDQPVDRKNR